MKYTSLLLILVLICGCSTNRIKPSKEDISLLHELINQNVVDQKSIRPRMPLKNKQAIREAEQVCKAFWNPLNLERYGELQWGYDLYTNTEFLILQTEVQIATRIDAYWPEDIQYIMPDVEDAQQSWWEADRFNHLHNYHSLEEKEWSICVYSNFYPRIDIPKKTVLHLTPKFKQDLDVFMGEDLSEFGTPSVMSTSQAQGSSAERLAATQNILRLFPDHWGDGWHYISHPEISIILFDHEYTKAFVAFRIGYEGGYTCLRKKITTGNLLIHLCTGLNKFG